MYLLFKNIQPKLLFIDSEATAALKSSTSNVNTTKKPAHLASDYSEPSTSTVDTRSGCSRLGKINN